MPAPMSSSGSSNAWRSTPSAEQATSPFIVLKFGGTSVSSVENWRRIAGIVKLRLSEGGGQRKIMIVHSALSGATDKLLQSLDEAMERRPSSRGATASGIGPHDNMHATGAHRATLDSIMCQHHDLADALGIPFSDAQLLLDPYRTELSRILEGASLIAEVSPRTRARVVAMGELMATSLGAVFLQSALGSSRVKWLEAREILRSVPPERNVVGAAESQFLTAVCDPKPRPALMKSLSQCEQEVFISQGFIAANPNGETVLLGRGGSDTSGSYFACLLQAERFEIWTDVPGMFTANPRMVPEARLLRTLSFAEAHELASAGAKVLHPRCIGPCAKHGIPIRVCDTFRPHLEGTIISGQQGDKSVVKALSIRDEITIVHIEHQMAGKVGFFASVFQIFKNHGISVDLVSTSKNSVTLTLDPESLVLGAVQAAEDELKRDCIVTVIENCATVSLIGAQIRSTLASLSAALVILREYKIYMMTANHLNFTFVVDERNAETILKELHKQYKQTNASLSPNSFGESWTSLSSLPAELLGSPVPARLPTEVAAAASSPLAQLRENGQRSASALADAAPTALPLHFQTSKPLVGFVGWRGMVGSVLMQRMAEEENFDGSFQPIFYSTSQVGQPGPSVGGAKPVPLADANDVELLQSMAVVVTCQGGDYTNSIHPKLRESGWTGYWIDAASALRPKENAVIVLDPINREAIDDALNGDTIRDFVGGNCTVSLMLMALGGLFEADCVEWITSMTYQSASGAGARHMRELVQQMKELGLCADDVAANDGLKLEAAVHSTMKSDQFPRDQFGAPLAGSLLPFIDKMMDDGTGRSKEEWKGNFETNKVLARGAGGKEPVIVDGTCVRVGAMRCHSQAITIKLKRNIPLEEVSSMIASHNQWVQVPNTKQATVAQLTPTAVSGSLTVAVGRIRKMELGPEYVNVFTVGDQLLWGAAEPVRRALQIVLAHISV